MAAYLSPIGNEQQSDASGNPLAGGFIYTYIAGTSTLAATFTDATGAIPQANPIVLNASGLPASPIYINGGSSMKFIIQNAASVTQRTIDNIQGVNDPAFASQTTEWINFSESPTFVNTTSFSLAGDQTLIFQINRRVKTQNTGGTIYSTITNSVFGSGVTTITVINDSGVLDSGLSNVQYGFLSASFPSIPESSLGYELRIAPSQQSALDVLGISQPVIKNLWRNSDGFINQDSSATSVADAAYGLFDRTYCLQDGGNVTLSRLNQPTDGIGYAMRFTQPDVSAKRIGFAQAVEAADCLSYRGSSLIFAPKLRLSTTANVRVALLAWTGTADTITRDVVNNWASSTYTTGNFFVASNLAVIGVGSASLTANTWADVTVTGTVPSSMNNLIMMVWTESAVAQNVTLDASCIRCGLGTQTPIWTPPDPTEELAHCQRFLPAYTGIGAISSGMCFSTTQAAAEVVFATRPRIPPTGVRVSSAGHFVVFNSTGGNVTATSVAFSSASSSAARLLIGVSSGIVAGNGTAFFSNNASSSLIFTGCEL